MLPISWTEDGWPMILEQGIKIPWQMKKPNLPASTKQILPTTGNFTWKDDFDNPKLGYECMYLRTPNDKWLDLSGGTLKISPKPVSLDELENPSFISRRQQHATFDAATSFEAPAAGTSAGVASFIREDYYFYCGIRQTEDGYEAFLEKAENGLAKVVASHPIANLKAGQNVKLSIVTDNAEVSYYIETPDGKTIIVAENEDATILSTTRAWGFIGAMMGPYARLEQ